MLVLLAASPAQEVMLRAPSIDALWCGRDGAVRALLGRRIVTCEGAAGVETLQGDAIAFDHQGTLAVVTPDGLRVASSPPWSIAARPFLASDPSAPPTLCPLFCGDSTIAFPGADGLVFAAVATRSCVAAGVALRRTRTRGFGLSGQVVDDVTAPYVLGCDVAGSPALFVEGDDGAFSVRHEGRVRRLSGVDLADAGAIEGFEFATPPRLADVDHDGVPDLVRCDPVKGIVAVFAGWHRDPAPPPRIAALKTPVLACDAVDVTGDGRADLVVLAIPPLGPVRQLSIVMTGRVGAKVLVYDVASAKGALSPVATVAVDLSVDVIVRDDVRRAEVRDLVAWTAGGILVAPPGGPGRTYALDGKARASPSSPPGRWKAPLSAVRKGRSVFATLAADGDRVVRFDL